MAFVEVSGLTIYPLKSAAGVQVERIELDRFGFVGDRRWMVVDDAGRFLTQRRLPRMCLLQAQTDENDSLTLTAPGMDVLHTPAPFYAESTVVQIWNDECAAIDAGDDAARWLQQFLGCSCRLVYFPEESVRQVDTTYARAGELTALSDGFPILLISEASLSDLNNRLAAPVTMDRFRPNLVVKGCLPFAEDGWKTLALGSLRLRVVKPCSRCIIPNIDQQSAQTQSEPVATLTTFRRQENKVMFGQNVVHEGRGSLAIGDRLEIIA
ncbi:MAG: MOSC N-terminal beta barrel domain-containing protein [Gammaproteobacteria bacterium]|nr:MOSC N-terminal beta barrel domain-containing protein [Gammaproteobacteria bacterium]